MGRPFDPVRVNAALLTIKPGNETLEAARRAEKFGDESAQVALEVYRAAMWVPVDWTKGTMDDALERLAFYLQDQHPWLSREAREHLRFCFTMSWK